MSKISFQSIPKQLENLKNGVNNSLLKKLYSKYSFLYLSCDLIDQKGLYEFLFDFLKKFKFLVYNFVDSSIIYKFLFDPEKTFDKTTKTFFVSIIICVEKQCLMIENIDKVIINQLIKELKSSQLNVTNDIKNNTISDEEKLAKEEISSFCSKFIQLINDNPFLQLTINSIVGYSIRMFFYPSNFFNDQTFFQFGQHQNNQSQPFDVKISKKLTEFFESNNEDENDIKSFNFSTTKNEKSDIHYEFNEKDFIFLRTIEVNESYSFYLSIHIESFYIFLVKKILYFNDMNKINHEIDFCQNFNHRCFTRFYGFLKSDEKITGFVYEFMCNGTLSEYFQNHSNEIDQIYSVLTMIRIFEGIEYLHSNSLIHRDLKPSNILLDHDNLPFISDFETIRKIDDKNDSKNNFSYDFVSILYSSPEQYNSEVISYSTDIYSFGLIVYFLFEKKDMIQIENESLLYETIKNGNIPKISKVSNNIQKLYELNAKYNKEKRLSLKENKEIIMEVLCSSECLDNYLIKNYQNETISKDAIQYFIETIHFVNEDSFLFDRLLHNFIKLKTILKSDDRLNILLNNGNSNFCEKNYLRAKKYYELAAKLNSVAAINNSLVLYRAGFDIDIDMNLINVENYSELLVKQNKSNALFNLGHFYFSFNNEKNSKAIEYYKLAAKLNDTNSQFFLGYLYFEGGTPFKQNSMKAIEYFEQSKNKVPISLFLLGYIYLSGENVEEDYLKAIEYLDLYEQNKCLVDSNSFSIKDGFITTNYFNSRKFYYSILKTLELDYFLLLGARYQIGEGVSQNYSKAKHYYEIGAEKNDSNALLLIGNLYFNGLGCQKDYKKAREYFEISAQGNNSEAYNNLGLIYQYGLDVVISYSKAKKYFEIAAKDNISGGFVNLGIIYLNGQGVKKDYQKAKEYFEISANLENEIGLFYLGLLYELGLGVKQDYLKAKNYYELSAEKNYSDALLNLGNLYFLGLLGTVDYNKAKECFELAIKLNNQSALIYLGCIYAEGYGVPIDHLKAKHYFELVAFQTNSQFGVTSRIESLYDRNKNNDFLKALNGFKFSSINNNSLAYINLANLYLSGKYFKIDYKKAIEYLEYSAKYEDSTAFLKLGNIFYSGKGVKKDYFMAFKYYEKSAHLGNQIAMDILGTFYMNGICVKPNFLKAKFYFEMAINYKNINAFYNLGCLYSSGELCNIDINKAVHYFTESIKVDKLITLIYNFNYNLPVYIKLNNENYYPSFNELGLIFLFHFKDLDSAVLYIRKAAFEEFPFAQNNYGLLFKYFLNNNNKQSANYMFKRSSEHNFSLAEFNLGSSFEESGNMQEAIHFYIRASEHEFIPLKFHGKIFDNFSLLISKKFIICLTNLKLVKYFYSEEAQHSKYIKTKQYFCRAISRLIIQNHYPFIFKFNKKDFTYLKTFIFNFPLFNLSDHLKVESHSEINIDYNSNKNKDDMSLFFDEEFDIDEIIFDNPESLFNFAFGNAVMMSCFMETIDDIIHTMELILYSPPYTILFGRTNAYPSNAAENDIKKNINHFFYEGFDI